MPGPQQPWRRPRQERPNRRGNPPIPGSHPLKPDYADAHNNLGTALARKGQIDEAIRQFQEAIRLKPDYAEARNNFAHAFEKNNHPGGP